MIESIIIGVFKKRVPCSGMVSYGQKLDDQMPSDGVAIFYCVLCSLLDGHNLNVSIFFLYDFPNTYYVFIYNCIHGLMILDDRIRINGNLMRERNENGAVYPIRNPLKKIPLIVTRGESVHQFVEAQGIRRNSRTVQTDRDNIKRRTLKNETLHSLQKCPLLQQSQKDPLLKLTRTRRISSSEAARRFPRDFFREQICRKSKYALQQGYLLNYFPTSKNYIERRMEKEDPNEQMERAETPKFNHKKESQKKIKINEYLTSQQEAMHNVPITPIIYCSNVDPDSIYSTNHQINISTFNVTLGNNNTISSFLKNNQNKREDKKQGKKAQKENQDVPRKIFKMTKGLCWIKKNRDGFRIRKQL